MDKPSLSRSERVFGLNDLGERDLAEPVFSLSPEQLLERLPQQRRSMRTSSVARNLLSRDGTQFGVSRILQEGISAARAGDIRSKKIDFLQTLGFVPQIRRVSSGILDSILLSGLIPAYTMAAFV